MPPGKSKGGVNKMAAVRAVLETHGKDTMPLDIVKYVKEEHNAEMSADMASTYKSSILKKKGKRGRKPGRRSAGADGAVVAVKAGRSLSGISLEDISAVKVLVDRMGADRVQQLAKVLAK